MQIDSMHVDQLPNSFASFLISRPCWQASMFEQFNKLQRFEQWQLEEQGRLSNWHNVYGRRAKDADYAYVKLSTRTYGLIKRSAISRIRLVDTLKSCQSFELVSKGSYSEIVSLLDRELPEESE